jgi:hypothetical protein
MWAWWEAAEIVDGDPLPTHDDEPQAGFYAVRRFRYGEWPTGPFRSRPRLVGAGRDRP